jgi:hypothetical protein
MYSCFPNNKIQGINERAAAFGRARPDIPRNAQEPVPLGLFSFNSKSKPQGRPDTPDPATLRKELTEAVLADDTNGVRRVLDTAFWHKLETVRPDGFHLLAAAQRGNRAMAQLLVTHGATWTAHEAKIARLSVDPAKLRHLDPVFRNAGIDTHFSAAALKTFDLLAAMRWAARAEEMARTHPHIPGKEKILSGFLQQAARNGLVFAYLSDRPDVLNACLRYRDPKRGNGTAENPLDVADDFMHLLLTADKNAALLFLDTLTGKELHLKPIAADGFFFFRHGADVVSGLAARGLLAAENPCRVALLGNWSLLQKEFSLPGGASFPKTAQDDIDKLHADYAQAARLLFPAGKPLSDSELNGFIRLHERRADITPQGIARMDGALARQGFFGQPGWTPERLKKLSAVTAKDKELSALFNRMAAAREIADNGFDGYLHKKRFAVLQDALEAGALVPDAAQTVKILTYLKSRMSRDAVTDEMAKTVRTLYEIGADCSAVNAGDYLGKQEPGLAKTMLDTGLADAESFDLQQVIARMGGSLQLVTPAGRKNHAYTEFACQLILEIAEPTKYVPQRGKGTEGYQQRFVREWMDNLSLKNGVIRYSRKPARGAAQTGGKKPPEPPPPRFIRY